MKKKKEFLLACAPRQLLSEEEKKHASFRAPKGSLDPMWRGCSALHAKACHVNFLGSLMGQWSDALRQDKDHAIH